MEVKMISRRMLYCLSLFLFLIILSMLFVSCNQTKDQEESTQPTVYVVFKNDINQDEVEELIAYLGYTEQIASLFGDPIKVSIYPPNQKTPEEIIQEFQREEEVLLATTEKSVVDSVPPNVHYIPGQIEVSFYPHATDAQIHEVATRHNCTAGTIFRGPDNAAVTVKLPEGKPEDLAIEEFNKEPLVKGARQEEFVKDL